MNSTQQTLPPPSPGPTARPTLFSAIVVEDDPVTSRLLAMVLDRHLGAIVRTAPSAEDAVPFLAAPIDWDAVFIDIGLPNADGLALLAFSKTHCPDAMHVIVSSRRGEEDRRRAQAAGADAYLVKPVDTATLLRTVDAVIERRAAAATPPSDWAA